MTALDSSSTTAPTTAPTASGHGPDLVRLSTWCGLGFVVCQLALMAFTVIVVLPQGGSMDDPALQRGRAVHDAADLYRVTNYLLILAGCLMLGFLGAVRARLHQVDSSGVLATVAVAAGTLLALVWPLGALLHDLAMTVAEQGTDLRILAGWDAAPPYTLALSSALRIFLVLAIVLGLRLGDGARALQWTGLGIAVASLLGSATLVSGAFFPALALGTLAYELWLGAVAWHWLRSSR